MMMKRNIVAAEEIRLRKAKEEDCFDLWVWRNHPQVKQGCFYQDDIRYDAHEKWFQKKMTDSKAAMYIAETSSGEKIGQARFDYEGNQKKAYISVNLNPDFIGKGLGAAVIKSATEKFLSDNNSVISVLAEILSGNTLSQRAFEKAGYVFVRDTAKNGRQAAVFQWEKNP